MAFIAELSSIMAFDPKNMLVMVKIPQTIKFHSCSKSDCTIICNKSEEYSNFSAWQTTWSSPYVSMNTCGMVWLPLWKFIVEFNFKTIKYKTIIFKWLCSPHDVLTICNMLYRMTMNYKIKYPRSSLYIVVLRVFALGKPQVFNCN